MDKLQQRLGRLPSPDQRDNAFPLRSLLRIPERPPSRPWRYWYPGGWWGDQGYTSQCVAYAWLHWAEDGPITQPASRQATALPLLDPAHVYCAAQEVDEWPGGCSRNAYHGTSVRAGAKVLMAEGLIGAYWWAWDAATVIHALLDAGPVVLGTWWYSSMFTPDASGLVRVQGTQEGGHAYVANGVSLHQGLTVEQAVEQNAGFVRFKNSWGRSWGRRGYFYMDLHSMDRLIREQGEACLATEHRRAA